MSSLIHCSSESAIIIAFAVLIQPLMHSPGKPPVPNFDQSSHIPFLTIARSALLIFILYAADVNANHLIIAARISSAGTSLRRRVPGGVCARRLSRAAA
ncbi:hypothetical protein C8J56DRAFT_945111, partial [Mycena floridula]